MEASTLPPQQPTTPLSPQTKSNTNNSSKKNLWIVLVGFFILVILGLIIFIVTQVKEDNNQNGNNELSTSNNNSQSNNQGGNDLGDPNSTDPIEKGKALSGGNCTGEGSKVLGSAPMRAEDISVIIPYGLLAAGHVTPIDHQYYWGKVQMGDPDMYDVLAPADGKIVTIEYRDRSNQGTKVKGDYRVVIMYSCTFFSYFDLATSLSPEIQAQLPSGWEKRGNTVADIDVKQGQVLGKVGGQSLDFAVWDTTKYLKNLTVPTAYNNLEPWKIVTVPPLDYFSESVKSQILPFYVNQNEPLDGTIDFDIEGKAVGNWFEIGTNGYAGIFDFSQPMTNGYWTGHFALVPNHLDTTAWMFSSGDINGQATQYSIKNALITPDQLGIENGVVKYELMGTSYMGSDGQGWIGDRVTNVKVVNSQTVGTALVQLLENRKLKVEVFMGKNPDQVTEFTSSAKLYDRGDNAKMILSNTAY